MWCSGRLSTVHMIAFAGTTPETRMTRSDPSRRRDTADPISSRGSFRPRRRRDHQNTVSSLGLGMESADLEIFPRGGPPPQNEPGTRVSPNRIATERRHSKGAVSDSSLRAVRLIFPVAVLGSSSTNSNSRGYSYFASRSSYGPSVRRQAIRRGSGPQGFEDITEAVAWLSWPLRGCRRRRRR